MPERCGSCNCTGVVENDAGRRIDEILISIIGVEEGFRQSRRRHAWMVVLGVVIVILPIVSFNEARDKKL